MNLAESLSMDAMSEMYTRKYIFIIWMEFYFHNSCSERGDDGVEL